MRRVTAVVALLCLTAAPGRAAELSPLPIAAPELVEQRGPAPRPPPPEAPRRGAYDAPLPIPVPPGLVLFQVPGQAVMAVGHTAAGFDVVLPLAPDWALAGDAAFALIASSKSLGVHATVKVDPPGAAVTAAACFGATRARVSAESAQAPREEKFDTSREPVYWSYRTDAPGPAAAGGRGLFHMWSFRVRDGRCFRLRFVVLHAKTAAGAKRVNRLLRFVGSFSVDLAAERARTAAQGFALPPEPASPLEPPPPGELNAAVREAVGAPPLPPR